MMHIQPRLVFDYSFNHCQIIFVTHNVREAVCLGDRVVLFSPNPGRIREQFHIQLPRSRDINSVELAEQATLITRALKQHNSQALSAE